MSTTTTITAASTNLYDEYEHQPESLKGVGRSEGAPVVKRVTQRNIKTNANYRPTGVKT